MTKPQPTDRHPARRQAEEEPLRPPVSLIVTG